MWEKVEYEICREKVADHSPNPFMDDNKKSRKKLHGQHLAKPHQLSKEEHARALMTRPADRKSFIIRELRGRRYFMLPAIDVYRMEMQLYRQEIAEYRSRAETARLLESDVGMPIPIPPFCPTQIPAEDELLEMVLRAREDPNDSMDKRIRKREPTAVTSTPGVARMQKNWSMTTFLTEAGGPG
mmetsp:Transcript_111246/g.255165  ORF Transcript_111246/g.255165 Transcript_111246/m.255165 type:complete len:184 (-) Transcript_111246:170-721(-)